MYAGRSSRPNAAGQPSKQRASESSGCRAKDAAEVARTLSNAVHMIVPKGSHANAAGGCLEGITVASVKSGAVQDLDLTCLRNIPAPKFVVATDG